MACFAVAVKPHQATFPAASGHMSCAAQPPGKVSQIYTATVNQGCDAQKVHEGTCILCNRHRVSRSFLFLNRRLSRLLAQLPASGEDEADLLRARRAGETGDSRSDAGSYRSELRFPCNGP